MRVPGKPTVPDVLPLAQALYASELGRVGCCLHITLDDHNIGDDSVRFCLREAQERGHPLCIQIAELLLQMSRTQRKVVASRVYDEQPRPWA